MKSNYWIKLYHEINYDPKIFRLSDRLFRRAIQCFALAGEVGDGGVLPLIDDMAFIMRCDQEQLETELFNLTEHGILSIIDGVYYVTNFSKWQAARTATERKQNQRDSERKKKHYRLHDGHETVTICDTEKEEEKEEEKEPNHNFVIQVQEMTGTLNIDHYSELIELFTFYDNDDVLECARWAFLEKKMSTNKGIQSMWTALKRGWNRESTNKQREEQWSEIH